MNIPQELVKIADRVKVTLAERLWSGESKPIENQASVSVNDAKANGKADWPGFDNPTQR